MDFNAAYLKYCCCSALQGSQNGEHYAQRKAKEHQADRWEQLSNWSCELWIAVNYTHKIKYCALMLRGIYFYELDTFSLQDWIIFVSRSLAEKFKELQILQRSRQTESHLRSRFVCVTECWTARISIVKWGPFLSQNKLARSISPFKTSESFFVFHIVCNWQLLFAKEVMQSQRLSVCLHLYRVAQKWQIFWYALTSSNINKYLWRINVRLHTSLPREEGAVGSHDPRLRPRRVF